jgi:DNA modification methylase
LRDYQVEGQIGLEATPEEYGKNIVEVFREVRRVLRKDGTCWVNLGDSYASGEIGRHDGYNPTRANGSGSNKPFGLRQQRNIKTGLKPKDLVGTPWRVAFALQADGWWLRSDIIWSKLNPMPESVSDRCTKSHEYIFMLAKSADYFYDAEAIREPIAESQEGRIRNDQFGGKNWQGRQQHSEGANYKTRRSSDNSEAQTDFSSVFGAGNNGRMGNQQASRGVSLLEYSRHETNLEALGRNKRSVWTVATQPYPEAHFATFPEDLIKPCILAGTSQRGACVECGAPWERVVETERRATRPGNAIKADTSRNDGGRNDRIESSVKTLGWRPTCLCWPYPDTFADQRKPTKPCIVLDPFAGSGTTVKVAQDLGRVGIGLDLKPDYLKMARHRTAQQGLAV